MNWPQLITDILQDAAIITTALAVLRQGRTVDDLIEVAEIHSRNFGLVSEVTGGISRMLADLAGRLDGEDDGDFHLETKPLPPETQNHNQGKENRR
ncbi:hypothetical protein EP30_01200 [Bifidobacterium sp. UTCIF-39]|uniref:hypothetical protein n=1 Tax=Bifidobacterium sp. UTCIF-39 TaxID=1465359 RepID=UPI001127DD14|nr:hypothetical protein [Bifidobacterium sp. UTCIF-39]TPF97588.1 hypothetical protein EP30_01200 [Bifidobacterium sp. UTCIF-39]